MKAAAFSLVVLTLNVTGPRRVHQGWPTRREAITSRLKSERADAAAFEEVWRSEDLDALADAGGLPNRAFDPALGLAVASRLPVDSSASRDLDGGFGALRARLKAGKSAADVYAVRLEPGEGLAAARRLGQIFRLAEFVREQSAGRPFALMGDLGVASDERDAGLLLDLLEARDLCLFHGDEACGRTRGDRRVDYVIVPYSSRLPRERARATFTDLVTEDDEPAPLHFGLRARLDASWLKLKPAPRPAGRDEALARISDALDAARAETERRAAAAGWIPYLGTLAAVDARADVGLFTALLEEIRSARLREVERRTPEPPRE